MTIMRRYFSNNLSGHTGARKIMANKSFTNYIMNHDQALPLFPLVHVTKKCELDSILADGYIKTNYCKVFNESLLYLFYGKPIYHSGEREPKKSKQLPFSLSCLCFEFDSIAHLLTKSHVFDTGAFYDNLYGGYIPNRMKISEFELPVSGEGVAKYVKAFFEDNDNYYHGNLKSPPPFSKDTVSQIICDLLKSPIAQYDDRVSTVEFCCDLTLPLAGHLTDIIVPLDFASDPMLNATAKNLNVNIIYYRFKRSTAAEQTSAMYERFSDHLVARNVIK